MVELGSLSSTWLAAGFIIAAFLPIPRTVLLIGAGAAYGLSSLAVIIPSITAGSILAFGFFFRAWFLQLIRRREKLSAVLDIIDSEGWRVVAVMRSGVPVPSVMQNYLFGLTRINILDYALATFVFSIPQAALFVFLGATGKEALTIRYDSYWGYLPVVFAVASTVLLVSLIGRRARRRLELMSRGSVSQSGSA
ncbi:MAG: VTT domain-containing protein [Hyphomicrobiales bacterium]|nr:VTT domain-containing protein [Hyphomicrobiales bacterium]